LARELEHLRKNRSKIEREPRDRKLVEWEGLHKII
jgi:hypothetical protein